MHKRLTPLKAIKAKCRECSGGPKAVRNCEDTDCALHPYRMGTNPNRSGIGNKQPHFGRKDRLNE